jgi:hypothetical protein
MSHCPISSRTIEKTKPRIAMSGRPTYRGVDRQNLPLNHKADAVIGATISGHRNQDEARPGRELYSRHDRRRRSSGRTGNDGSEGSDRKHLISITGIWNDAPLNLGLRFSTNARRPSMQSSRAKHLATSPSTRRPVLTVPIALGRFDGKFAVEMGGLQLQNPGDLAAAISAFADKRL